MTRTRRPVRTHARRVACDLLLSAALLTAAAGPAWADAHRAHAPVRIADVRVTDAALGAPWNRAVMPRATALALRAVMVPSFSRQTGLPCSACHYQFPQLSPFGRLFKLNGYTMTGLKYIRSTESDSTKRPTLALSPIPPVSAMAVASLTSTRARVPGTQNGTASFPQQASIFFAGAVSPRVGIFSQFTYAAADNAVGIDNTDIRFASHATVGKHDLLYGLTLNNNPTVQDVWNTVPAWGFPFMASDAAPSPNASTLIDGGLAQQVVGLGAYGLWNSALYTEVAAYRSAPQGAQGPLDSSAVDAARGVIPYFRVGLQHQFTAGYLMVGTFGLSSASYPSGVSGPTNGTTDLGFDTQFERPVGDGGAFIVRGAYVRERRRLGAYLAEDPAGAANARTRLNTVRLNATYQPSGIYGFTAGVFGSGGTTDTLLYAPAATSGSASGSPSTRGYIAELSVNPWQNVRVAGQYVGFTRFNGAGRNYDGTGRSAGNNGTLYLYTWIAY